MPRYDDRYGGTRLYVGHLSSRTRSRDLEDLFSRYGRVRDVDLKRDFAFVEFSDPRDADDARYSLNGREFGGSRIVVELAKGVPRGPGGSREYLGRGPPPGSGRCFNCGIDGHWARDCKAGDWKNKCYRCGERGHIERNCQNSPKNLKRGRSYSRSPSRSPSPRRGQNRGRSDSRSRSYSRSRSPSRRDGHGDVRREKKVSRSPPYSRSPIRKSSSPPPKGRKRSPTPDDKSPLREKASPPPMERERSGRQDGSEYSGSPRHSNGSPRHSNGSPGREGSPNGKRYTGRSPQANGQSPNPREDRSPAPYDDNRRGSESPSSAQD